MSYLGMNNRTGRALSDLHHIWQSVRDILTTPIGTRTMRRHYGSDVPDLIDQPLNGVTRLRVMSASVAALVRWEPRIAIKAVRFEMGSAGAAAVEIDADRVDGLRRSSMGTLTVPLREASV